MTEYEIITYVKSLEVVFDSKIKANKYLELIRELDSESIHICNIIDIELPTEIGTHGYIEDCELNTLRMKNMEYLDSIDVDTLKQCGVTGMDDARCEPTELLCDYDALVTDVKNGFVIDTNGCNTLSDAEVKDEVNNWLSVKDSPTTNWIEMIDSTNQCHECKSHLHHTGGCVVCMNCGYTKCD